MKDESKYEDYSKDGFCTAKSFDLFCTNYKIRYNSNCCYIKLGVQCNYVKKQKESSNIHI